MSQKRFAVVGAGFSGAVVARELARHTGRHVVVFDERSHVAGNCHTERDTNTGVMQHVYGSHIFHTNRQDVWDYVNAFMTFRPYFHRVMAHTARGVFSLPINLMTINQFFGKSFTPQQAEAFLKSLGDQTITNRRILKNRHSALWGGIFTTHSSTATRRSIGDVIRARFRPLLKCFPVRFSYNDCYYDSLWQGIPEHGYTDLSSVRAARRSKCA